MTSRLTAMQESTYKRYMLVVLLLILAFNSVDRLALGLLLQDIKVDLDLSDSQLGLLTGLAFALFYSVMGIPIARWADRGNRVTIISLSIALWSGAAALCSVAGNFLQLLLIRIGVAVGEGGCTPPAHSLIADYFDRAERPRAVAFYMLGGPLSAVIGYLFAGWLNELYGWRATFVILSLPGLALSMLAWFTLREPRLARLTPGPAATGEPVEREGLRDAFVALWANRTFRHLMLCYSLKSFFGAGIAKWLPAFFIRTYGMQTGKLGTWFALIIGVGGLLGTWWGGEWASRRAAQNERLQLRVMGLSFPVIGLIWCCVFLAPTHYWAGGFMAIATVVGTLALAPLFGTIQSLIPDRMRALSIAVLYLVANLIGMGLGPLAVGVLSDLFRPAAGDASLRYALVALCPIYLWGAWHLLRASKTVTADLALKMHPAWVLIAFGSIWGPLPAHAETVGTVRVPAFEMPPSYYLAPETPAVLERQAADATKIRAACASSWGALASIEDFQGLRRCSDVHYYAPMIARQRARYKVTIRAEKIGGVATEVIAPAAGVSAANASRVLINLHGGGFIGGGALAGQVESIPVAAVGGLKIVSVDYRVAPEHHFPAASEDVAAVYEALLKQYKSENIGIYGCSAGGILTAQSVAWFQKRGLPTPGAVGMFCAAALDVDQGDSSHLAAAIAGSKWAVPQSLAYFREDDLRNPLAYPGLAPEVMARFPPALLITSTRDKALSSVVATHAMLVKLGVRADLHVWDGLGHAFFYEADIPESREVYAVIARFFAGHLGGRAR